MNFIQHIENSINKAENFQTKLPQFLLNLSGMSSRKNRILLNGLCDFEGCNLLEVGSYQGSTFMSSIYGNNLRATSIDYWPNYPEFKETRDWFHRNLEITLNIEKEKTEKELLIINKDCFTVDKKNINGVNVYFYDGDHSENSQYKALTYFEECLADEFIYICDDWNSIEARRGSQRAILDLKWKINGQWILPGAESNWKIDCDYYFNGLGVFLINRKELK